MSHRRTASLPLLAVALSSLFLLVTLPGQAATDNHRCLALAMYWEAKAEGDRGMLAVGQVVLNRVAHEQFPDSICAVVTQGGETPPCQFSWWCDGKSDRPREAENWAAAQRLAQQLMKLPERSRTRRDPTRGALFFHAKGMKTPWRIPRKKTATIGGHVFYALMDSLTD
ncbi:MAG: cell wall hydrolase [Pseudomonadota bacterium]